MSAESFGAYIKSARYAKGLTRSEVAEKAKISRTQLRTIEDGKCKVRVTTFVGIVDALGLDRIEAANVLATEGE